MTSHMPCHIYLSIIGLLPLSNSNLKFYFGLILGISGTKDHSKCGIFGNKVVSSKQLYQFNLLRLLTYFNTVSGKLFF